MYRYFAAASAAVVLGFAATAVRATDFGLAPSPTANTNLSVADTTLQVFPESRVELAFRLHVSGNPFDYTQNDVRAVLAGPNGFSVRLPAFFDGDDLWRVRCFPPHPGTYRVTLITVNGAAVTGLNDSRIVARVDKAAFQGSHGFVERDPRDTARLQFADGSVYYPLGQDVAWQGGSDPSIPQMFAHMGAAGENWARVWMNHWDGKNLDWPTPSGGLGTIDLGVARKWDGILQAGEQNGIYIQMTLQHHGQYSSTSDSNWSENPWNQKNGGFLAAPEDFFTDPKAAALTRAKYRYIIARYGYSPHLMAFELFNEVQWTDGINKRHVDTVDAWHQQMAAFLRAQDPYHHLITTSSDTDIPGLFDGMDYIQPHTYPPDVVSAAQSIHPSDWKRPIFFGEIGGGSNLSDADLLHEVLWASIVSDSSGAAEFWGWDHIESGHLYPEFAAATSFLRATGLPELSSGMHPLGLAVQTSDQGHVSFGPGGGWGASKTSRFLIQPSGTVVGVDSMPSFLQGRSHADLFTHADFPVDLSAPATFSVVFQTIARSGAHPQITIDGATAAERDYPASGGDVPTHDSLTASVPAGHHVITLTNTGPDWVDVGRFSLAPYGPTLAALGKADDHAAVLWVRSTETDGSPRTGTITLPSGLRPGQYRVTWYDTTSGAPVNESTISVTDGQPLALTTPPITHDDAVFVRRVGS